MGMGMPETRYARSGDVMVAYQVLGQVTALGDRLTVAVPGAATQRHPTGCLGGQVSGNLHGVVASRDDIDQAWHRLSAAITQRDAAGALAAIPAARHVGLYQASGPAVLLALAQHTPGAEDAAQALAAALLKRDFDGDATLAAQLAALASGQNTGRRPLVVDLEDIATVMGEGGGWLDLRTRFAWPQEIIELGDTDEVPDPEEDPESGLWIPATDARDAWQDMADYIDTLDDRRAAADLRAAIEGKGAFARFQKALDRHSQWGAASRVFSSERQAGRTRAWLGADTSYDAVP